MDTKELLDRIYTERRALDASVQILKNMVAMILEEEKRRHETEEETTIERMLAREG